MFSSSATIATRNSVVGTIMATLQAEKPQISIVIVGDYPTVHNGRLGSFSTLDTIKGEVSIIGGSDIRFDDIQITFEGIYRIVPIVRLLTLNLTSHHSQANSERGWRGLAHHRVCLVEILPKLLYVTSPQ